MPDKFVFPRRGFHVVADKVAEADYFLQAMEAANGRDLAFRYLFSAFLSASRSITFALQAVMRHYPGFEECVREGRINSNRLASRVFLFIFEINLKRRVNYRWASGVHFRDARSDSLHSSSPPKRLKRFLKVM